jgi:RND superfamily putative drug exporter
MAFLLYRLGKFAYRRRWWVVSAWLAVMVAVGASAVFFSGTLTNNFSIPGTESQRVADQLRRELPEAVGGTGTVVFRTDDGASFTPDQEAAVREALAGVADLDGVRSVVDPFAVTEQLEGGRVELESGRAELASGQEQLDAGRAGLEQGQRELDAQRDQLEQSAPSLPGPALEAARAQLAAGQQRLDAGRAELEGSAAELEQGRTELELAERRLEASSGIRLVAEDRSAAVASVQFEKSINSVSPELREAVQEEAGTAAGGGVTVDYSKDIVEDVSEIFGYAEIIGLLVAALVLVLMLGTLVAAGLPLLMAVIGVGVGVGITFALSGIIEMNSISPVLALMLGLAVGIDYSLFIVNRHRTQLLHGMGLEESVGRATGTAGNAVLFAGLTVVVALAALAVPGLPFLTVMGLSAAGTVAVSVLVALTLTPALLAVLGTRLISARAWARHARRAGGPSSEEEQRTQDRRAERGRGWGGLVTRRPALPSWPASCCLAPSRCPRPSCGWACPTAGQSPPTPPPFRPIEPSMRSSARAPTGR